jgi:hypothetical protein
MTQNSKVCENPNVKKINRKITTTPPQKRQSPLTGATNAAVSPTPRAASSANMLSWIRGAMMTDVIAAHMPKLCQ